MTGLTIPFTGLKKQYNNLRAEILDATDEVLRSGQLMSGNYTAEFENWLAKRNRVKHAITVHSGTSALEVIAEYYSTHPNRFAPSRVLIPSMTYAATANAFIRAGWEVIFADCDGRGLVDLSSLPEVNAVVLVGLYGAGVSHLITSKLYRSLQFQEGFVTIEDAAQHWLAEDCNRCGAAAAISFDPMKNLPAYGNGGAVVTNDRDLNDFARMWRNNGKNTHQGTGTNSRMSEIDCAQLLIKTRYLDKWQERRKHIAKYWMEQLKETGIGCLIDSTNVNSHSFHKFVITADNRDRLKHELAVRKIETKIHYNNPLHELGTFRQYPGPGLMANSSALARRVLSLPIYPELTDLEVEYVIDQVRSCALA